MKVFLILLCTALFLAACGSSTDKSSPENKKPSTINLSASTSELIFSKEELVVSEGKNTIRFTNPSSVPHNVAIDANGKTYSTPLVADGKTASLEFDFKKGETYRLYCEPHGLVGMETKIVVK